MFTPVELANQNPENSLLPLPTAKDLKTWIKTCPLNHGKHVEPYNLGGMLVNPKYLLDILEALPGCIAYRPKNKISVILFVSGDDRGILGPVRPEGDAAWTAEELAA